MVFSSTVFLFLFLPLAVILYSIVPEKMRNSLLLAASLVFYGWGEPVYILLMIISIIVNYTAGIIISEKEKKAAALAAAAVFNLGLLAWFKYAGFAAENIGIITGTDIDISTPALPIGISFYTFQALSYAADVYRGRCSAQKDIISFGMYICFFPQLIAGPIVRYTDIKSQLRQREYSYDNLEEGLIRFITGLGKKVIIANQCGILWEEVLSYGGNTSALTAWVGAIAFTLQIYYDFSGYSDMAIGLGKIFGFNLPENFNYPYRAKSVSEFWRRWHMTLGVWFRDYLYIPLGGNRKGIKRQVINLFLVWFLTGLWHGAGWNFIIWGLYYFVFMVVEKLFLGELLKKLPKAVGHIYTMAVVIIGWVIFAITDITVLPQYLKSMAGLAGGDSMSLYYINTYLFIIVMGFLGSIKKIEIRNKKLKYGGAILIFIIAVSFIIGDSYNPFLYFRF